MVLLHLLVAAYRGVFRTWSNIYKRAFFAKILNSFKLLTMSQMFDWVENRGLAKGLKYWVYSCSKPINEAEKILSQKIYVTSFLKKQKVVVEQ